MERSGGGLAVALTQADLNALEDYRDKFGSLKLEAT
jgi:hypothetical protein